MKRTLKIAGIFVIAIMLFGCAPTNTQPKESAVTPSESEPVDPLMQARQKLYQELGLTEDQTVPSQAEKTPELPVVLPTPPELPKTDE